MANQANFNLLSFNVRGINNKKKRLSVFRWLNKKQADIIYLQETYSSQGCENQWQKEWGGNIYFSHGTNHSRGVATLFRKGFDCEVKSSESGDQGRWICIDVLHNEKRLLLINIYAPNTINEQICLYKQIKHIMSDKLCQESDSSLFLGGDFIVICNSELDKRGGLKEARTRVINIIEDIKTQYNLCDVWRIKHPRQRRYTWKRSNPFIQCRLDYWLITEENVDHTKNTEIIPSIKSDHCAVTLEFREVETRVRGRGYWKINSSILDEEEYIKQLPANKIK